MSELDHRSDDLFEWTNLFPRNTGLPVTIWVKPGVITTDPYHPDRPPEYADVLTSWVMLNSAALLAHFIGAIDGIELGRALQRLP